MKKGIKRLTALAMAGTMVASLAGCMPTAKEETTAAAATTAAPAETKAAAEAAAPAAGGEQEQITIRMNWWGGDARHEATLKGIEAFEAKYPHINVEAEYEAFNGHEEKIALALKSGNAADVLQMNMDWIYNYSPNGDLFVDLNTMSDIIDLTAYEQSDLDFFTINGSLQALTISNTARVFAFNKGTFDKIGVPIPTTLDELLAAGDAFAAYEDGSYYPMACDELDRQHIMAYYLTSKYDMDCWISVPDYVPQFDAAMIQDGLEFMNMLEDRHVIPTLQTLHGDGAEALDSNPKFMDGHYAGLYQWDSNVKKYATACADSGEMIIADFPVFGQYHGGLTKASQVLAIPKSSAHPEEAAMLIQFLFGEEEGAKILGDTRGIPANKNGEKAAAVTGIVADAHNKAMDWVEIAFDPIFERSALKNTDGTYYLVFQMLSYEEDTAENLAQYYMDEVNKVCEAARQ